MEEELRSRDGYINVVLFCRLLPTVTYMIADGY